MAGKTLRTLMDCPIRIYLLCIRGCEETGPFYIGATSKPLMIRLGWHLQTAIARPQMKVSRWLKEVIDSGAMIDIKLLEEVPPGMDWGAVERYHIEKYRMTGAQLLNVASGGAGPNDPMSDPVKKKISITLTGHIVTEETRQKIRAARAKQVVKHSDQTRANMSAAAMGRIITEEAKVKMSAAAKARWTPERCAEWAENRKQYWARRKAALEKDII